MCKNTTRKSRKLHVDEFGKYVFIRRSKVVTKVYTQEMLDKHEEDSSLGAIEHESKNGWLKLRVRGILQADRIILAFPKKLVKGPRLTQGDYPGGVLPPDPSLMWGEIQIT